MSARLVGWGVIALAIFGGCVIADAPRNWLVGVPVGGAWATAVWLFAVVAWGVIASATAIWLRRERVYARTTLYLGSAPVQRW